MKCLALSELSYLHKCVWDWALKEAFLYMTNQLVVSRGIFQPRLLICTNACGIELQKTLFIHFDPVLVTKGIFQPWLFIGPTPHNMVFFIPEVGETLLAFTILDVPGLFPVDILALSELSDLHKCVQYRASKEAFLFFPDVVSVNRRIYMALTVHQVSLLPLNIAFFNPSGWGNPLTLSNFGPPRPCCVLIALLHWSWSICTNMCVIEL